MRSTPVPLRVAGSGCGGLTDGRTTCCPAADPDSEQRGALRFDGIEQPWLKEAAKRWTRARLLSGTTFGSMRVYVRDLAIFGGWLARPTRRR